MQQAIKELVPDPIVQVLQGEYPSDPLFLRFSQPKPLHILGVLLSAIFLFNYLYLGRTHC